MMKSRLGRVACGVALLGSLTTASVGAWSTARYTSYLTFSAPFALPGVTLPAGTYIFELAVPESRPDVVQVRSRDRSQTYLTAFTREIPRPVGLRAETHLTFREVLPGLAPPIKAWFPVGEGVGREFVHPVNSRQLGATSTR